MEECEMFKAGKTELGDFLGKKVLYCPIEKCPYGKEARINWEGEYHTICLTKGLVEQLGLIGLIAANDNELYSSNDNQIT